MTGTEGVSMSETSAIDVLKRQWPMLDIATLGEHREQSHDWHNR
jgi:hypothetical protein